MQHQTPQPQQQPPIRVLVAEDNAGTQQLYRELLEPVGYQVIVVDNGRQAVNSVRDGHVDVVLMDVQMPVMDGFQATKAIRELTPPKSGVPVIAITSLIRSRNAGVTAGVNEYLSKPVDKALLLAALEQWTRPAREAPSEQEAAMPANTDSPQGLHAGGPAAPVMNLAVSLARMGQDRTLLLQLVEFFLEDAPKLLAELEAGVQSQDAAAINRAAHSLKGLAANFEALPAVAAGKRVEDECRNPDPDAANWQPAVAALHAEIKKLTEALAGEVANREGAG